MSKPEGYECWTDRSFLGLSFPSRSSYTSPVYLVPLAIQLLPAHLRPVPTVPSSPCPPFTLRP